VGLDEAVGILVASARELLGDNIVVIFSSDNGASTWEGGLNYPLRSGKFAPFEGGVRVPGFVLDLSADKQYFGPGNRTYEGLVHITDWMPTLLSLAGIPFDSLTHHMDGFDLSAAIRSDTVRSSLDGPRTSMLIELYGRGESMLGPQVFASAYRKGDFKLMEGIFQDFEYYYETNEKLLGLMSWINSTDKTHLTFTTEAIIRSIEWMFGKHE
jgi:arylsulfatase A-like enzyme